MNIQATRQRLLASTMIGGVALMAFAVAPAAAQEPVATEVDTIIITGSRIARPNLTTTSPVTQVTSEDVDIAGVTRVEDLVNTLPQAFAAQNSTVANGASGTATVSLRNLGSSRTLVMIDGRRMPYGSPADAAADLNQIPAQLVERVEILTGGASAVYGSDAVAGVVNFIMRRDFEGVQLDAQYGYYQHHNDYDGPGNLRNVIANRALTNPSQFQLPDRHVQDGFSRDINLIVGASTPDGRGNITAYAGYRNNDAVLQGNRDFSACAVGSATAAGGTEFTCGGSATMAPALFTDFSTFFLTLGSTPGTFRNYNPATDQYNYGPLNYYQRPDERYSFGAFGRYEVNRHAEVYTQLMMTDYSTVAQIAPSGSFFNNNTINCGNPLMSTAQANAIGCDAADIAADNETTLYIGRRNVEGGGRQDDLNLNSFRGVVGVRGDMVPGWDYDATMQYSKVRLSRIYRNEFSVNRLARALDVVSVGGVPTCRSVVNGTDPDCVPYNVFSLGGISQEALDYVQIPLLDSGTATQELYTFAVTGDLGTHGVQFPWAATGVQVALGVEHRRDSISRTPDITFQTGDGAGQGGATNPLNGSTSVNEVFAELQIPIADGQAFADQASINLAYRYSDYGSLTTDTYTVGGDWAPIPDLRFRGSFSRAVRAANVIELFTAQGFNLFDMDFDPCGPSQTATLAQCVATGVPAAQYGNVGLDSPAGQYNFLQGGNPFLEPEEADTLTYGFVFRPAALPGFDISVDYFDIDISNLIGTVGAQNSVNACYEQNLASACDRLNRNAAGQLWIGSGFVENTNTNVGGLQTRGVDINANYGMDLATFGLANQGNLAFTFAGTYLKELTVDPGPEGGAPYDCIGGYGNECGTPTPEWRHRFRVAWNSPMGFQLAGTWRHIGEVSLFERTPTTTARVDRHFDSQNYFDLAATWQVLNNTRLRVGVNNVFDNDPPLSASVGTTGNGNTYPQTYDALGRWIFFGITADF